MKAQTILLAAIAALALASTATASEAPRGGETGTPETAISAAGLAGVVRAWGADLGTNTSQSSPVAVSGLTTVTAIAAGTSHSLALLSNGTVRAWGSDGKGQLGNSAAFDDDSATPVAVSGLSGVTAIAAGLGHSLALLSDGTVRAWGFDGSGQLGDGGANTDQPTPVAVSGLSGVTAIDGGDNHSLARLSNGSVRAWGNDNSGQLGDGGTNTNQPTPVAVSSLSGVTAIAAGGGHSLALLNDDTIRAWGSDGSGQLGDGGTNTNQSTPVAVSGLTTVTAIAGGGSHSLALLGDGTVRAWGNDLEGELGDGGTDTNQPTPVAVSGLSGATAIAAGGFHSLALLSDGSVRAWGFDNSGQLGDGGANTDQPTPVAVSGLGGVTAIAAGFSHSLAVIPRCRGRLATRLGTAAGETLTGTSGVDVIVGGGGNDTINGLGGDDVICGGDGRDTITGGPGDDIIDGGTGSDTSAFPGAAVTVNLAAGTAQAGVSLDQLFSVENARGSNSSDTLIGNGAGNKLEGLGGNDILRGGGGSDNLLGGPGKDTLEGGNGADTLNGGTGADTASYPGASALTIDLLDGSNNKGDTLSGIENVRGSDGDDSIRGNDGANRLDGLGGADQLIGRAGDDILLGGAGNDTLNGGPDADTCDGGAGGGDVAHSSCELTPGVP
ncbi:MAG: hypothetical protein WEB00_09625 [Dehalococcoidia bacterium]